MELLKRRDLAHIWHPCSQMKDYESLPPIPIKSADKAFLKTFDGRLILDCISSWWVNLFGHCEPRIANAIAAQAKELEQVIMAGFTHEGIIRYSERLCALLPDNLNRCFYADNGSSAVEISLKMAYHFFLNRGKNRPKFINLTRSYHGETLGALAVGDVGLYKSVYDPLLLKPLTTPSPSRFDISSKSEHQRGVLDSFEAELNALKNILNTHQNEVCAIILEPLIQCAGNMNMFSAQFVKEVVNLCKSRAVLVIFDEIAVGFGRTGTMFALDQCGVSPDFLCLSKGITGGFMPLSVVVTSDEVYSEFYAPYESNKAFLHSHSYTGNALAIAAANAVLDIFQSDDILAKNKILSSFIWEEFSKLREFEFLANFRQTGMVLAFDLIGAKRPRAGYIVYERALKSGFLLRPLANTIYFMPPYCISKEQVSSVIAALKSIFTALKAELF